MFDQQVDGNLVKLRASKNPKPNPKSSSPMNSLILLTAIHVIFTTTAAVFQSELLTGYEATPDPTSTTAFQPLLLDRTGNFSLSFLRVQTHRFSLAVVHVPSGEPLWTAAFDRPGIWSKRTRITFNGSIVISDPLSGAFWSTSNTHAGDRVVLSASSNLQILASGSPIWQSFDFPSDTLLENQNFTSNMTLLSSNQNYKLRLGPNFIALYAKFNTEKDQIYFKHTAKEARARIIPGQGPIHIRISSDGYLGMYQKESEPVDLQPFTSYERSVPGMRRIRLEPDGNLKGYYWSGSEWILDYKLISETCELPSPCGPYGLCRTGVGCTCLDDTKDAGQGECYTGRVGGDLCGKTEFRVLKRKGVELPFKEQMGFFITTSFEGCEKACESNCSCWGAVYSNASGYCYPLDYPIQTLVSIGDKSRVGYFKVRTSAGNGKTARVLGALLLFAVIVAVGFGGCGMWKKWRVRRCLAYEGIGAPATYKYLESEGFGSIELSKS